MLLDECRGDEIWPVEHCRVKRLPEVWIEELSDCFESGFRVDRETIYVEDRMVNQFHGLRDVDIAYRLAEFLGVDVQRATVGSPGPVAAVRALKEAVEES